MATLEGTITKYKRKPNLLNAFIDAMENGDNSIIQKAGHMVYSEYEDWADEYGYVKRQSSFLPNLDENNNIVSYSLPTYGYALVNRVIDNSGHTVTQGRLLQTYNRFYFSIDTMVYDTISFTFKNIGLRFNEMVKDSNTSTNYSPCLWAGIILEKDLQYEIKMSLREFLNQKDNVIKKQVTRLIEFPEEVLEGEDCRLELDLRDLTEETPENKSVKGYIIVSNIESGDIWENPEFNPNENTEPAFIPRYTCSAPDLIDIDSIVYNKAPTIPEDIEIYHNGDPNLYLDIPETDLIEGVESRLEWTPSVDLDETPELDILNMGHFTLPVSLSRGDVDKDGKIDQEDLKKLDKVLNNEENFNDDGYGLWAATISKFGSTTNNNGVNTEGKEILTEHLNPNSEVQIKSDTYEGEDWESEWNIDISNNLYYIDVEDERITPEVRIELYNEYLYNLGTFKKIQCNEGSFRIYVSCCPTGGLFTQENYDGEQLGTLLKEKWEKLKKEKFLQVEYKIITESYKKNILRKSKNENIVYELILEYDNEDIEKYWILSKDKDYLDIPFIQDLYYEYCKIYAEREEQENKNKFLKLLPKKATIGYELNSEGKLIAILPAISEEEQFINNIYMFKSKIVFVKMASIDYYGVKSLYATPLSLFNTSIHYLNNINPSTPSKVIFQQDKNNITLIGAGALDEDTNIEYKKPAKDLIRYEYEYLKNNQYIQLNSIQNEYLHNIPKVGLGDFTKQGKINDLSLIRLSAYMYQHYIPSLEELPIFHDLTGEKQIDQLDIELLKKYINEKEHFVFPGLDTYKFIDLADSEQADLNWELISELGLYRTWFDIILPDEKTSVSIYLYNYYLYNLGTFVKGEIERKEGVTAATLSLYFTVPPTDSIKLNYSIQTNNYGDEVKLYKYTQWYPTPLTFSINKQPDEVEYIKVRARATDRMAWSDWKEFEGVAYPDIWLGVRNFLGGGSGVSGAVYIIADTAPTDSQNKKKIWYCSDKNSDLYGTLNVWDENQQVWIPATGVFVE